MTPEPESVTATDESAFDFDRVMRTEDFESARAWGDDEQLRHVLLSQDMMVLLASHHSGLESFAILFDRSATWGLPGAPALLAIHVVRDPAARAFSYAAEPMPIVALAQQWLVGRGCPADKIVLPPSQASQPADRHTTALEERLRSAPGRYEIHDHYTDDGPIYGATVLLHDTHPDAHATPWLVLRERADLRAGTYTLREGAFASNDAAHEWLNDDREAPLPPPRKTSSPTASSRAAVPPPAKPSGPHR